MDVQSELMHYGVMGMKWGVRRSDAQLRRSRGEASEDYVTARKRKKKPIREMSNAELRALNERLTLERTNNQLQSRSALAKIQKGTAVAGAVMAVGTTITTAYNFSQSPAGRAIFNAVVKKG